MKNTEIIKPIVMALTMPLCILTKTPVLQGNKTANGISAFLIVGILIYYSVNAFMNIKKAIRIKATLNK